MLITKEYNFGTLEFGKTYNKDFTLSNDTNQTITITKVINGGCTCVVSKVIKTIVRPGDTSSLSVSITPGSKGIFRRSPIITYKVGDAPEVSEKLDLMANVE